MKSCKPLIKRIKGLGEINVDFLAKEARAFHFDMGPAFADLMLNPEGPTKAHAMVAAKLVTVCATLNEYPHIRYRASSKVSESIAQIFHKKMNDFVGSSADWWYYGDPKHTSRERGQILLLGRTDDALSPLMHEFTYQAMVNDLLPMKDDQITYSADKEGGGKQDKDVLLNEKDEIWVELRGQHIAAVIQTLSARIRDVVNSKTGSALNQTDSSGKPISMSQMASALKALPEYKELMSKLSMHMTIAHRCMEVLNKKGLMDLSDLEQTLATGTDDNGSSPKLPALIQQVDDELSNMSDPKAKLRLLLILIVSQKGLQENVRDRLLEVAQLSSSDKKTLMNLEKMGISTVSEEKKTSFFGYVLLNHHILSLFLES
jgi:syntaxin-binding protein 1